MSESSRHSYQMFLSFLNEARQHEQAGTEGAWKLYLHAARCLLEVASQSKGETRDSQLSQVQDLLKKADALRTGARKPGGQEKKPVNDASAPKSDQQVFKPVKDTGVNFSDIAGMESVKQEVLERVIQPMRKPELYKMYRIKAGGGILMFGLPGTGKTMIARAIAHEVNASFYHVRSSDVKDKWVGSSERNIAALFEQVRSEKAAVLFIDEFDGIGGKVHSGSSSSEQAILAELKSQMDGFEKDPDRITLLLGATNKPWDIDTAFLRSGRFSRMIYVPLPDAPARSFIIKANLKGVPMSADVDFDQLTRYTDGFSGADLVAFCDKVKIIGALRADQINRMSEITMADFHEVRAEFRSTVVRSDIDAMKEFMLQNSFKIPEHM
ncbi:MAG: ATP-binding protein [Christensenellales bacterium]|jgi:transitional endoplasmic reticulum ATPase